MDFAYLYVIPVSTIIIGLSVGFIKISEYVQGMHISNTNLIMRQSDQIGFMLKRLVDLNKKINNLELEFTTLSAKQFFTYDDDELVVNELVVNELVVDELVVDELVASELVDSELVDEVFEIINATATSTIAPKKTSWFSF